MIRIIALALALLSVLVAACSAPSPAMTRTLVIDVPEGGDVSHIPWLMAVDVLKEEGYTMRTVDFSATDPATVVAMEQEELDITALSNQLAWSAIGKGAPLVTFLDTAEIPFVLATTIEIQECADLDGRSVAISSMTSVSGAMFKAYVEGNCPDAKPNMLIVKRSNSRVAALLSGEVDAATLDHQDLAYLQGEEPGAYHALIVFADEFPGLQTNSYVMRTDFGEQYPEFVKDLIREVVTARRSLQDPQTLREEIINYLEVEPSEAQKLADLYLSRNTWDVRGEYTLDTVQATMDFLQEYGDLPPETEAKDAADLSYYEEVLDEIGRQ
jgi:ABC-type nitrate/sulfonate/bicarbonate transport system substrate-binding protein